MAGDHSVTRVLLVEDNPADADLVRELLEQSQHERYAFTVVERMSEALDAINEESPHVVLLDLRLPDCAGTQSVIHLRGSARGIPIVVLTGTEDDVLALECIEAGAEDYVSKNELTTRALIRTVGYAIARRRETQIRELEATLAKYRQLATGASGTSVTAALAGSGAVRDRYPDVFSELANDYKRLLEAYLVQLVLVAGKPRAAMESLATRMGDLGAGPRDLLDVHLGALDLAIVGQSDERSRALMLESRLLALEMMGLLVEYYRVGGRRLSSQGESS